MFDDNPPPAIARIDPLPAKLVYLFYIADMFLIFILILPILRFAGVVIAYLNIGTAPAWLATHYRFQIRTFWINWLFLLIFLAAGVTTGILLYHRHFAAGIIFAVASLFVIVLHMLWMLARCLGALPSLTRQEPHPRPASWGLG